MVSEGSALLTLLGLLGLHCVSGQQQGSSLCYSQAYRQLSVDLQNEHQCIILENLQKDVQQGTVNQVEQFDNLFRLMSTLNEQMRRGFFSLTRSSTRDQIRSRPALTDIPIVRDCQELQQTGTTVSGIYPIQLPTRRLVNVRCDMETSHGGWTVIQRRIDGSINFTRTWVEYAFGFGNVNTEYWLGNEHVHLLTTTQKYSIRIDLWDWNDNHVYAQYDNFRVDHENTLYQLHIQNYTGTAGDAMGPYHDGLRFSTIDSDNDQWHASCAKIDHSGWWFGGCGYASLNGVHSNNVKAEMSPDGAIHGLVWYDWKNDVKHSLKKTEMKIKPLTSVLYEREQEQLQNATTAITNTVEPTTSTPEPITTTAELTTTTAEPTTSTPEATTTTDVPTTMRSVSTTRTSTTAIPSTTVFSTSPIPSSTTSAVITTVPYTTNTAAITPIENEIDLDGGEEADNLAEEITFLQAIRYKLEQKIERFKILNKKDKKDLSTQVPMTTAVPLATAEGDKSN